MDMTVTASYLNSDRGLRRWTAPRTPIPSVPAYEISTSHLHTLMDALTHTLCLWGRLSLNTAVTRMILSKERLRANIAGYWKVVKLDTPSVLPHTEKAAPILGPNRNPSEKAAPTRACTPLINTSSVMSRHSPSP